MPSSHTSFSPAAPFKLLAAFLFACGGCQAVKAPSSSEATPEKTFPKVEIVNILEPLGESNVRSSFSLGDGSALVGTEETADIYKTTDGGSSWSKIFDGGERWGIHDVRNYVRGQDGHIYITTTEPAMVCRSKDEGHSWEIVTAASASRTVGIVQLEDGTFLVGLRRALTPERTSVLRSEDSFESVKKIVLSETEERQNVTCFGYLGGEEVLAGIGYRGSGKIYKSTDGGLTWEKKAEFPEARDLMRFFVTDDAVFVLASGISTLYKSTDGGETWIKDYQIWPKGFVGEIVTFPWKGTEYWLLCATDQQEDLKRHYIMISDDEGASWHPWIEVGQDESGAASNLSVISANRIIVGTGNHAAQGKAYTLEVSD